MHARISYALLIVVTLIVGLFSRKVASVPAFTGDILYAIMIYWCMSFVFFRKSYRLVFCLSVIFCFVIEAAQVLQYPWLKALRDDSFGRLVLGQGFLWSDLIAYTIGAILAMCFERYCLIRF